MTKVVIKILQGSAVTQTKQGGIRSLVANFSQYTSAKKYENRFTCESYKRRQSGPFFETQCSFVDQLAYF